MSSSSPHSGCVAEVRRENGRALTSFAAFAAIQRTRWPARHLRLAAGLVALVFASLARAANADILISKAARTLEYRSGDSVRTFRIGLGTAPIGPKRREGDRKTPEGVYFITHKNPKSQFFLSLGLSYPNVQDAEAGLRDGLIDRRDADRIRRAIERGRIPPQNTPLGGTIFIHGRGSATDWTWGCIALDDDDMAFLFDHARVGERVEIRP